jgi:hypothetical protein
MTAVAPVLVCTLAVAERTGDVEASENALRSLMRATKREAMRERAA